jgi:hypothetical protein
MYHLLQLYSNQMVKVSVKTLEHRSGEFWRRDLSRDTTTICRATYNEYIEHRGGKEER